MSGNDWQRELAEAHAFIRALEQELAQTNRGLLALTVESEKKSEEIRTMSQQLWQAAKLATMGELAASIAHELNNPLATVSLRVEGLMVQLPPDDLKQQTLAIIEEEVRRMGDLVANLLQFSRRGPAQISTVDVCEEMAKTLELIQHHLRNHRISVVQECAPDVPMIHADRQQLRQLFLNLFTNASDAMPKGGTLTLRVRAEEQRSGGAGEREESALAPLAPGTPAPMHVVIEVADTGVGIAPEDLSRVMDPFFTTKPEGKGTGLGLPICRRIVQEHRGTLEITSEVGQGTTVRITLPAASGANGAFLRGE